MTVGPLQVGAPWALLLLLALVPMIWLGYRRLTFTSVGRRFLVLALRSVVVALVVLALADLQWRAPGGPKATIFLIDSSASTAGFQAAASAWVRQALERMGPEDQAGVVAFGREPVVLQPLGKARDFRVAALPRDDRTDLAAALRLGQAMLPAGGVRRLVVLSDGWENLGSAEQVMAGLAANGIVVDVVKPTLPASGLVIRQVEAPALLREGDPFDVSVQIESAAAGDGRLALLLDGRLVADQPVRLRAGTTQYVIPLVAEGLGFHRLEARVSQGAAQALAAAGFYAVKPPGSVLLYEDRPGEAARLNEMLRADGLQTEVRLSTTVPPNVAPLRQFDAIALVNVAATSLTLDQQRTIQAFVRDLGKGLVIVGGPNSFALGDYGSHLLGELLPMHADIPPKPEEGTFGLALVIDKSGSMDLRSDGVTKMQMAKEAALLAVDMLRDDDIIAIVVFDSNHRWLVPPQRVSDNRGVPAIQARITSIQADGGTEIFPALERAVHGIRATEARYKHVLLLSDGQAPSGDYDRLLREARAAKITISAVAVGADSDTELMSRLGREGGGRYYFTERVRDIPRIVAKETSIAMGATTAQGRIQPQYVAPSPALRSFVPAQLPTLATYAVTTPRDAAETVLISPSGDPLLAHWQYGNGRTIAWTSGLQDDWAGEFATWPERARFWGQIVRYAMGVPAELGVSVRAETEALHVTLTVDALTDDGQFVDLADVEATVIAPSGTARLFLLRQEAPGRYRVQFTAEEAGAHEVRVRIARAGLPERNELAGFVAVADPEARSLAPNDRLLNRLSGVTGGRQIADPAMAFADTGRPPGLRWMPLWPWLLGGALVLFVFDIAARRLRGIGLPRGRARK
ncbi:MAG: VWA domain-containing protein [Chloroflexota bacterium]|nr:VWA domain-containing protein [Dehalococcoidia bacterium]MDW8254075.1 VWA domain-containing protein [Chloroflexota bacterium]